MLVLEVDANDTKETFISAIINKYGVTCPTVAQGEGAEQLFNSVKNDLNSAGVFYLIKPDKTFKEMLPGATEIDKAGGNIQHVCPTDIKTGMHHHESADITIGSLITGKLNITVRNADTYTIAIHSANGRLISSVRAHLETGANTVVLQNVPPSLRILVVSIKNERYTVIKKCVQ